MNDFPTEITENILEYMIGGNSTFCVKQVGEVSGEQWYNIRKKTYGETDRYFVSIINGRDYIYAGYFYKNDLCGLLTGLRYGTKVPSQESQLYIKPLIKVLNRLVSAIPLWDCVKVISDGKCSCCGRKITDFDSLKYGMGPTCRAKRGI